MNNNRELALCWRMYCEENNDRMPLSSDDGTGTGNPLNQYSWANTHLDFTQAKDNWDRAYDIPNRPLWKYAQNYAIYKDPADTSYILLNNAVGTDGMNYNGNTPRVRSYSMNFFLGGFGGADACGGYGVGSWCSSFPVYLKASQLTLGQSPGPANTWVFIDERQDAINWGNFMTDMAGAATGTKAENGAMYQLSQDLPSFYHGNAGCLSFADGHSEIHRWIDGRTMPPLQPETTVYLKGGGATVYAQRDVDILWLHQRTVSHK
jgi:hypothetical protein